MDIIVLEGIKSCGKTGSLGLLYALMVNTAGTTILCGPADLYDVKKDFAAILDYPGAKQGRKKIAIATGGDGPGKINLGVAFAIAQNADILIAANSTGKPSSVLFSPHVIQSTFTKTQVPPVAAPLSEHAAHLAANMKTALDIEAVL